MHALPSGTVSLVFTDVEGSTALLSRLGSGYAASLDEMRRILRAAWADFGGVELGTEGDSFFVVFETARQAVGALVQAQRRLGVSAWPGGEPVRVRMGAHTGAPTVHNGAYVGMDVHRAARIAAAAHGGQLVLSAATAALVAEELPEGLLLRDLGEHQLKDLGRRERLFQVTGVGLQAKFPPLRSLGAPSRLPEPPTPTVGRSGELDRLADTLTTPRVRLLTLTGAGGSGKTRLATELARRVVDDFPDGVFFVPLASVTTANGMWNSIAEALDAPPEARTPSAINAQVGASALLVLDNLEQLREADTVVAALLAGVPAVRLIATSRRPLHLPGEHEYLVPPLELPIGDSIDEAAGSGAVQLFVQCARQVRPTFVLTEHNAADIAAVCRRLDGLPLALELAAARVRLLSPAAVLGRLDSALDLETTGRRVPSRQRTLRDTIAWSYDLLTRRQQGVLRRLSVFRGGADLRAIAAVVAPAGEPGIEDPLDAIAGLVEASLVDITEALDGEPRVRLLEIVRDYAHAKLTESGEVDVARERHARHYVDVAEEMSTQFVGSGYWAARAWFEAEDANLGEVFSWALPEAEPSPADQERLRSGLRLCKALNEWLVAYRPADGGKHLERALERAGDGDSSEIAACLRARAVLLGRSGQQEAALVAAQASVEMAKRLGDVTAILKGLIDLGGVEIARRRFTAGRPLLQEAVRLARESQNTNELHDALQVLAMLEASDGDLQSALDLQTETLAIAHQLEAPDAAVNDRQNMACSLRLIGRVGEAHEQMYRLVPDALNVNWASNLMILAEDYACVLAELGQHHLAAHLFGAAEATYERFGQMRDPRQQAEIAGAWERARAALTDQQWNNAYNAGQAMEIDDALRDAHAHDALT